MTPAPTLPDPYAAFDVAAEDGVTFRLRAYGNRNGTRLVIGHGNGFAVDGYAGFWTRFLHDFDVLVFDMRNHGQNPGSDPAHHDYAHFARDIETVFRGATERLGAKPSIGAFHSLSAQAALKHAIEIGWVWEALILFDPPNVPAPGHPVHEPMVGFENRLARWAGGRRRRFERPDELARDYAATRAGGWVPGTHALMAHAVLRRDAAVGDWVLRCPPELEAAVYLEGNTLGLWPNRRDVAGPVAVIAADPERPYPVPTALSNRAWAAEGGFDYAAIPGSGHLLQLEQPQACAEAALAFLQRVAAA
ncbi:MAG: alpha/beta hydrolase [Alphaproteobacteria bacterium]|nr:alpha/beta hydrolase [Alphaproteobacteria bacterium]